jgi:protein SCO1/2
VIVRRMKSAVAAVAIAMAAGCGASSGAPAQLSAAQVGDELHGGVLDPPNPELPIALTDTAGRRYDVMTATPGRLTLLYFGYTHCPDVCPTTMADIAAALRQSEQAVRSKVTVVFVTVDPHRDSQRVLRSWLDRFNSAFVGLRGSLPQVIKAQRAAGIPVSKVEANGKAVEHAAQVIAYTPDHLEHVLYFDGPSTTDDLRHDLPILVSAKAYT